MNRKQKRTGVGETCAGCGEEIEPESIPVNVSTGESVNHYHLGCNPSYEELGDERY